MKKKLLTATLMLALILLLTACSCEHDWKEASCTLAKTCQLCSETEGEALGHTWTDASCTVAKTCQVCGETEGEALGHAWKDASCEAPKTCTTCNLTEGEALVHDWQEATTEAPKTCALCALTEGERIITDSRFTTASTQFLHGKWTCEMNMPGEAIGAPMGFPNGIDCIMSMDFSNDGNLAYKFTLKDEAAFKKDYRDFTLEYSYYLLEQQGMSRADADAAILQETGMTMDAYVDYILQTIDIGSLFSAFNITEVYYVEDGQIYTAMSWKSNLFDGSAYTLNDGILIIDAVTFEEGGEPLQWKKAD